MRATRCLFVLIPFRSMLHRIHPACRSYISKLKDLVQTSAPIFRAAADPALVFSLIFTSAWCAAKVRIHSRSRSNADTIAPVENIWPNSGQHHVIRIPLHVMHGLVPGIHVLIASNKASHGWPG